ncbi:MAG: sugar transferase [Patescibacteria group bacterium]|nr:sugar transferase [Patescibacteria group bacterium]
MIILILHKLFILFLILLASPFIIIIGLLIYVTSGHPILFFQKRIGKHGKEFTIIKFRTMIPNAHALQPSLKKTQRSRWTGI